MKPRGRRTCAYCGIANMPMEKEHVIPRSLYPRSKKNSKIQRITVPACAQCNRSWADDEPHFRNMMLIAGEPNEAVKELWADKASRSFYEADGERRVRDLFVQMLPTVHEGQNRLMVYPHKDLRVARVLRKIVRGLSSFHQIETAIADERVLIRPAVYELPERLDTSLANQHREEDILRYRFCTAPWEGTISFWVLTFFEQRTFYALVEDRKYG